MKLFRFLLILTTALGLASVASANRVALVIGNSKYAHAQPLPNPVNDATAMAEKMRSLGFDTVEGYDLDFDDMRTTLREFARKARNAEISTIFYAGHGIAVDGVNYLVPVDASLDDPVDWEFQVYDMEEFLRHVRHSKGASLIFLDACRDNPLADTLARNMGNSTRSVGGRGLAKIEIESNAAGMAIAFATSPGKVAQDGAGNHSPFTEALLKHIGKPNTDISEVMSLVTGDVFESTDQQQRPWINASLTGPVVLNPVNTEVLTDAAPAETLPGAARGTTTANASIDVQKFMFDAARESNDPADFQAYIDMFPDGLFAQMARNAVRRIEQESAPAAPAPVQVATAAPTQQHINQPVQTQVQHAAVVPQQQNTGTTVTRSLAAPLVLTVTPALRAKISNQHDETLLNLNRNQKREIQGRLNALGHNVGGADGSFGPKTRRGVSAWQSANGIAATGFLNAVRHQLLVANSENQYQTWLASRPIATKRKSSSGRKTTKRRTTRRNNNNAAIAAGVAGFAAGVLLGRR